MIAPQPYLAYEIRTLLENSGILKSLLCQVSNAKVLDFKFIPYELYRQTNKRTIREIIIQQKIPRKDIHSSGHWYITTEDKE